MSFLDELNEISKHRRKLLQKSIKMIINMV